MAIPVIFLPGILAPAPVRYGPLLEELDGEVEPLLKELEIYAGDEPPENYSVATEVEGLFRAADAAGFERFHLFGHSAGGAIALAAIATDPARILSAALDEPASDHSEPDHEELADFNAAVRAPGLTDADRQVAFLRFQLAEGVELPPPPPSPPPPEFVRSRALGMSAFTKALESHRVPEDAWQRYENPVYFSHGSLSHPRYQRIHDRLAAEFPDFRSERFEGLHHLRPCHQAEPARAAAALRSFWRL